MKPFIKPIYLHFLPLTKYRGATFNCLRAHVVKLSQLHPKHYAQTLAENGKLLGLNPNHKPLYCFKPLKKKKENMYPDLCKT